MTRVLVPASPGQVEPTGLADKARAVLKKHCAQCHGDGGSNKGGMNYVLDRAKLIGRVFQNPFSGTAPGMSVAENLALAARRGKPRRLGWSLGREMKGELLERVRQLNMGLENQLDDPIGVLSGGQRQALTLLMATWLKPDLLLLDEHTAALDPKSADQVIELTDQIIQREKLTTLMVTHSMHQAANLGDRLVMMHRGGVIQDFRGSEKRRLRVDDLLARFEEVRRAEQLDETAAGMLRQAYV